LSRGTAVALLEIGDLYNILYIRSSAVNDFFRKFANKTSEIVGSPWAFIAAVVIIIAWAASGPIFGFSDTWQLVINTGTTIITFLMVFLIQNTQNRDAKAIHLKLDELLRAVGEARTGLVDLEDMSDEDLRQLQEEFKRLHERYGDGVHPNLDAVEDEIEQRDDGATSSSKQAS
jgi:low affinity Fe/Cu permease